MATEANWDVGTTAEIDSAADGDTTLKETYSVQIGAQILYQIKETLKSNGWSVVSSSTRTSYDPDDLATAMTFNVGAGDNWDINDSNVGGAVGNLYKIIYPSVTVFKTDSNSVRYNYLSSSSGATGRSWCLMKWDDGPEPSQAGNPSGKRYHLLLDYASSTSKPSPSSFALGDLNNAFGSQIGIYIFPDYGDAETNNFDIPSAQVRPHHKQEIGIPYRPSTTGKATLLFKIHDEGTSSNSGGRINFIHGYDTGAYHSHVITYSGDGVERFLIVMSNIADVLDKSPSAKNGTKYFLFWSNISQGSFKKPFGVVGNVASNLSATSLSDTICDGRTNSATIFYYSKYDPNAGSNQYIASQLNTSIPAFITTQTRSDNITAKIACMFKTTEFSKITSDGTYVEWPLPLMDIIGNNSNYRYVGRMLDIKIGPLLAPMGLLAKPSGATNYDRLMFNTLWLPYNSPDAFNG
jgi:hypothetical protein